MDGLSALFRARRSAATPRAGAGHATIYPYGPYPTSDGTVLFGLQNDCEWAAFAKIVLQRDDLSNDPRFRGNAGRIENREMLESIIKPTFMQLTTAQAISRLEDAGIGTARVNKLAVVWGHPQIASREKWMLVETTAGWLPALVPPGTADWSPRSDPVPELGQHTSAILRELDIDRWPGQPTPKTQWSGGSSPSCVTARDQVRRSVSDRVCRAATL
jgi:itaconate CoA-transferase